MCPLHCAEPTTDTGPTLCVCVCAAAHVVSSHAIRANSINDRLIERANTN